MLLSITPDSQDQLIAKFAALAIGIHVLESVLPSPIPGIKPGLANIITLVVFMGYGMVAAAWVSILRVIVGSLIVGSFLSPTFALSFSGAITSLIALYFCGKYNDFVKTNKLNILSIAILMSMSHVGAQFIVAYIFFIPHSAMMGILPVLMTAALIFGVFNSIIAIKVNEKINRSHDSPSSI